MTFTHLTPADYITTQWSGGTTTQLLIAPVHAVYANRDFLWRVSSATVELDESDFTALPDYRRYISTVRGDMTLSHNGGPTLTLHPGTVHAFDGGEATHSWGRCTDFNLMLRKGGADGALHALSLSGAAFTFVPDPCAETVLLFCASGHCCVLQGDTKHTLAEGESLLIEQVSSPIVFAPSEATVMAAEMWAVRR